MRGILKSRANEHPGYDDKPLSCFGASAPGPDLMRKFAVAPDKITLAAKTRIARNSRQ